MEWRSNINRRKVKTLGRAFENTFYSAAFQHSFSSCPTPLFETIKSLQEAAPPHKKCKGRWNSDPAKTQARENCLSEGVKKVIEMLKLLLL